MEINKNYSLHHLTKLSTGKKLNVSEKSVEPNFRANEPEQISNVTPDYNVSVPMTYSKVEEMSLPEGMKAHVYKLANGQKVVIVPKDGSTVVKSYVNTGSLNEPDKLRGISHYIEHNLFNGSEALGDLVFFDEVNKMGAYSNASTSFSVTDYVIKSQLLDDNDLENKIKLHAGMLQSPKFAQDKLDKEKKIVDSEINMCLSDDASRAQTLMLKNLFNIKSTAPDLVAGSTDNIDALTREDVVNYFNDNYYPANTVTVITGDVNPDETIKLVSKYFTSNKQPKHARYFEKLTPTDKPVRRDIISTKNEGAAQIFIGFEGPANCDAKEKVHLLAVQYLLSGLANSKTRNIGQKYSTDVSVFSERVSSHPSYPSANIIAADVSEANVEPFLKDLYAVLTDISNNPPTEDEFMAIKNQLKKDNSIFLHSSGALNYHLGMNFLNQTPDGLSKFAQTLDNMTYQDFIDTARKYYDLNRVSMTVVHPVGSNKETINKNYQNTLAQKVSFTGASKKTPLNLSNVEVYKMPNNFELVFNDADTEIVNYELKIDKKKFTPHKAAVADVLCDMLKNGGTSLRSRQELDSLTDKNAISMYGVYASDDMISLFSDFPVDKIELATNLFAEQLLNPEFSQDLLNQAKNRCKDSYEAVEPNPYEKYRQSVYKNTYAATSTQDVLESLPNVTLEDVKQLYNEIFALGQGNITLTGPFKKHPELKQIIFNNTSKYPYMRPKDLSLQMSYEPTKEVEILTTETKRNQAEIVEGFKFEHNGNIKDSLCLQLLSEILGGSSSSRLFSDLREKRHLAYAVGARYNKENNIGVMELFIKTTTNNTETGETSYDNVKKSIDGFNENIQALITQKVSDDELNIAKRTLKTALLSGMELNSEKNNVLSTNSQNIYGLDYTNQKFDLIDTITADDILNTAKNVFKNRPVYSLAATKDALDANKEFLESLKK